MGRALSRKLGWSLIDLDAEIERSENLSIPEIFKKFGEPHFRQIEYRYLQQAAARPRSVIALGGGAYVNPQNRAIADATGLTIWLKAEFSNIIQRVKSDGSRPLFEDNSRAERLFEERQSAYALAQLHVSTDDQSPDAVAAEIMKGMKRYKT